MANCIVSSGVVSSGIILENNAMTILNGGTAIDTTVNFSAGVFVSYGGSAVNTILNQYGSIHVMNGGYAENTTVNSNGYLSAFYGGTVNNATVNVRGSMRLFSGCTALNVIENGGYVMVEDGANVSFQSNTFSGLWLTDRFATLHSNTTAVSTTLAFGGLTVYGGTAYATTISNSGHLSIYSGTAENTTINSSGTLWIYGGSANNTTVNSCGLVLIDSSGKAENTTINYGGKMSVWGSATVTGTTNSGFLGVYGGTVENTAICDRAILEASSGTVANTTVKGGGCIRLFSKGVVSGTVISNSGWINVFGGSLQDTYISSGGQLQVSGGTVKDTEVGSGGQIRITNGSVNSTRLDSGGVMRVSYRGAVSHTIIDGGVLHVSGGTVSDIELNGYGYLQISSGGTVKDAAINRGYLFVTRGGTATGLTVQKGCFMDFSLSPDTIVQGTSAGIGLDTTGGTLSNWTIDANTVRIYSGGTAEYTTVNSYGCLLISSGGTASSVRENGGYVSVEDGASVSFQSNTFSGLVVNNYQSATAHSGTTAASVTIHSSGKFYVFYGGLITDATVNNGGTLVVLSGGVAENTTVNGSGHLSVSSGGRHSGTLQIESGAVVSAYTGAVIDFTVAKQVDSAAALINDWSLITNGSNANYTLTVNNDQATGTYVLANGAGNFNKTISVKTADNTVLGAISVGESKQWNDMVYTLSKEDSILSLDVTSKFTLTAASANRKYNGTALADSGFALTSGTLIAGDVITAVVEGSITDVGTTANKVTSYKIMRGTADVTARYALADRVHGSLTVTKRDVTLNSNDAAKIYDGTPLADDTVTVSGDGFADGEGASYTVIGSQLDVGSSANSFTYTLNDGTKAGNYNISTGTGTLTVNKISTPIIITANSASRKYDGTALTETGYSFTQGVLVAGDELFVTVAGSITDAGSAANKVISYKVMRGVTDVTGNYTFADSVDGTLTVTQRNITLTSADDSKVYDGTALTNDTVTVSGDGFAQGESFTYNVTGTQTEIGSSRNTFAYSAGTGTKLANYLVSKVEGTLTVSKAAQSDIDGNGISDVMFQYTGGDRQIGFWMNGTNTWQGAGIPQDAAFKLIGAYDMNADGNADSLMIGSTSVFGHPGIFVGYYLDGSSSDWKTIGYLDNPGGVVWENAVGNLTGNAGCNSIVWQAPELGALGVWTDGTTEWVNLGGGYDENWKLQGCGDFNGDGKDEVLFANNGNLYTIDIDGNFASLAGGVTGWEVCAIGDFTGDGQDDVVLFHSETGSVIKFENGTGYQNLGQLDATDWFVVGAGDYNDDQQDDLLVRQYSTGMLGYYSAGDMSKWNELGRGVDMNWTVVA